MVEIKNFKITYSTSGFQDLPIFADQDDGKGEGNLQNSKNLQNNIVRPKMQILKPSAGDNVEEMPVSEFANQAGVTPQAVRKMIAEGRLQARKLGNQYVIKVEELYRYFSSK